LVIKFLNPGKFRNADRCIHGGTPNLAAIKTALNVNNEAYIMTHTYDLIISSFFLLFVMTVGQSVLSFILPSYKYANGNKVDQDMDFNGKNFLGTT